MAVDGWASKLDLSKNSPAASGLGLGEVGEEDVGGGWHLKVRGSETLLASIILLESESSNPTALGGQERNSWIRPPCTMVA